MDDATAHADDTSTTSPWSRRLTSHDASLPCRPTSNAAAIRGSLQLGLPSPPTCAVVGSSDILRLAPHGPDIDAHTLVWRLNNAPTANYEPLVGSRTSLRVINHVPIEKWVKLARNRSALSMTADGSEYTQRLCAPEAAPLGCIVSRMHASSSFHKTLEAYREHHATHRVSLVSDSLHQWGLRCNQELHGTSPSGGLFAVLLALSVCEPPISLYGFWPFCCHAHRGWPAMNYKYNSNRTRFVCCSRGRERMEVEYAFYERLERRGLVRLVTRGRIGRPARGEAAPAT